MVGDPLPPFTGKLRVYNMRFCPFAQRTILALNAKEIDYEVVNIDLVDKPEWLASKSAFSKFRYSSFNVVTVAIVNTQCTADERR